MRQKSWARFWALAVLSLTVVAPVPAGAQTRNADAHAAARAAARGAAMASFEGRQIDLSGSWGDARACLVWRQGGVLECFRTFEALDAREAQLAPARDAKAPATHAASHFSCAMPLRLYEHNWYGGRQLSFWDRGYWQNLWYYGFDNQTSSYAVGACYVHLADYPDGRGWWYPGPTYPYAGDPVMGWQDVISSIYIE